jgi:hypothetical protein
VTPILTKSYKAEAAVAGRRIVKFGTADNQVIQAAAVADLSVGIAERVGAAINEQCDVIVAGIAECQAGGAITRGDFLTSDATGKALASAPAAGVNNRVVGIALASGVLDDFIPVLLAQGRIQG